MMVDYVEPFVTAHASHLRVGWAMTEGYSPYPGGGEGWGGNGVGDDLYSYGYDGLHLWSGKRIHLFPKLCTMMLCVLFYEFRHSAPMFRHRTPSGGFAQCPHAGC